ncbi:MAG TPA: response regulator [Nitrospira sp.]|nr:response regulator [Nitrospira sp.]
MSELSAIRLLLVEDQILVRQGLRSILESNSNVRLVGEARDGEEAIACVEQLQPRVVLMDINMPKMDGVAATRQIKTKYPGVAVVGISVTADGYHQAAMRRAGAFEVVSKASTSLDQLYETIERAAASADSV